MVRRLTTLAVLSLALASPAAASPPRTIAPPGNSAIDEYMETVPGTGGDARPGGPGGSDGGTSDGSLSAAERQDLQRQGRDGRQLASVVDRTSPAAEARPIHRLVRPSGRTRAASDPPAGSAVGAVLAAAVGRHHDGGVGLFLPVLLLVSLLGAVVLGVVRRRPTA